MFQAKLVTHIAIYSKPQGKDKEGKEIKEKSPKAKIRRARKLGRKREIGFFFFFKVAIYSKQYKFISMVVNSRLRTKKIKKRPKNLKMPHIKTTTSEAPNLQ